MQKQVNGIGIETQEADPYENGSVKSAGIDGSIGSDTDMNKAEAGENLGKDTEGAVPRYTVKKASSFKPVSVTKTFLMKAGSTSVLPKSAIDKGLAESFLQRSSRY